MMRITYRDANGVQHIEDMLGPSAWGPLQYRQALARQRPGITVLCVEPVAREVRAPRSDHPAAWWITLRTPGRPLTTVLQPGGWSEARRLALSGAETTAQIVRMVKAD